MERDGDDYVLNGRKWWTTNALHANCKVLIVMGKTDPDGPPHRQQSMMVVPIDAPGRHGRARPAGLRLPGPRGSRRDRCSRTSGCRRPRCSPARATAS